MSAQTMNKNIQADSEMKTNPTQSQGRGIVRNILAVLSATVALMSVAPIASANNLPTVSITSPTGGQGFASPATVTVTATASDSDGTIAQVDFYQGSTLIGTATSSPYTITWSNVALGTYSLTAKATDNQGGTKTSSSVTIYVETAPTVSILTPADGFVAYEGSDVTYTASSNGNKVTYYSNGLGFGNSSNSPFQVIAHTNSNSAGTYSVTAVASTSHGVTTTSAPISVTILQNAFPTVSITNTTTSFSTLVSSITLTTNAADSDGSIASVDFYDGSTNIGTVTSSPFNLVWNNPGLGTHSITAVATDNRGAQKTSAAKNFVIDVFPTVSLTSPTADQGFAAPGTVTLTANASDSDGTVAQVDFYSGTTLLGTVTTAPYTFTWNNVPVGTYTLKAKATDNLGGATTSSGVTIYVETAPTVSILTPADGFVAYEGAPVTFTADSNGSSMTYFKNGTSAIGGASSPPFTSTWVPGQNAGGQSGITYQMTARAASAHGVKTTSAPINITVLPNALPTVSISNATTVLNMPISSITLTATAADSDGSVTSVDFYRGSTLIGTSTSAPFNVVWNSPSPGNYNITAVATDNHGAQTTSSNKNFIVNYLPTVSLTSPTANQNFTPPGTIALAATAADSDGSINKVEFYQGTTLIGTDTSAPYTFNWTNVGTGSYTLTAKAYDNRQQTTTSSPLTITVDAPPTVSLTAPANNAVVAAGNVTLTANASDSDGTVAKVDFYQGSTLIGTATSAPYTVSWNNVAAGSYSITAVAIDNLGVATTSSTVAIVVDAAPTVSLTSPTANQVFTAPGTVTVTATAADSDGTVSKVDFYQGTTLIGTATSAPYTLTWNNVAAGSYSLTAVATDNQGVTTTSGAIAIVVDTAPTVSLTSPTANQVFSAPASSITLTATAADTDGSIAQVDFYQGTTLIGTATSAPYSIAWTSVAAGSYSLTAKATDNNGVVTTSSAVAISVDTPPAVTLTGPANAATYVAPATVALTATASDSDGSIAKVDFYQGSTLLGTSTSAPYAYNWNGVTPGSYTLTAVATDNLGLTTTSTAATITVAANQAPTVSLTSPSANQAYNAPATVTLTATAADSDGSITQVDFYQGSTLIGSATSTPYTATWTNVAAGSYALTAVATDDKGGTTTSTAINITVNAATPVYYIYPDHLGTPRLITDATNTIVWRNLPMTEPFGNSPVEDDPNSTGNHFTFNLRYPGQYADVETNTFYNYFRDYDPGTGRYIQSDPIGLAGGSYSTYGYVNGKPLNRIDPQGLSDLDGNGGKIKVLVPWWWPITPSANSNSSSTGNPDLDAGLPGKSSSSSSSDSDEQCKDKEEKCDMRLVSTRPSFDGKTYTCVYQTKGTLFTFPQAVGYPCPPVDMKKCLVDTSYIMPPARY